MRTWLDSRQDTGVLALAPNRAKRKHMLHDGDLKTLRQVMGDSGSSEKAFGSISLVCHVKYEYAL